ncbi:MAG: DUF3078 domain-containing protein [Prolixibacteraceae bacterium]|nr:DUF3078 domain-containing protein [Prolixibacteraceae bacterium]MBN2650584.1 DUF3078 domain-containing protein [Prolixibacteraceae bacterium]
MNIFKRLLFILFIFLGFTSNARSIGKQQLSDTIKTQLEIIKSYLYSDEWKPHDAQSYHQMIELVQFIENSPVDSLIGNLKIQSDSIDSFLVRDIRDIKNKNEVPGYIDSVEIERQLEIIERKVINDIKLESVMVPEDAFLGGYSQLSLIPVSDIERLIADSIITMPDSLVLLVAESSYSQRKAKETDSIVAAFLEEKRKTYNDSIINAFRDSISAQFRTSYRQNIIDSLQQNYIGSVTRHNNEVLTRHNKLQTEQTNEQFLSVMNSLLTYANRIPYELKIYNLHNDSTTLKLQNDRLWYEWIWLKNRQNDSIGIRIENLDRNRIRILVDETVNLSRLTQRKQMDIGQIQSKVVIDQGLRDVEIQAPIVKPWSTKGKIYTGITETFINDYWSKGGKSSMNSLSSMNYSANYSKKKLKWENSIDAKLGFIYYFGDDVEEPFNKNSDNFEINTRFGFSAFKKWYYSGEANFKTQLIRDVDNGDPEVYKSALFSPAYLTFSGGFDFKPNKELSIFLSPLSLKTTFVTNPRVDETRFGIDEGKTRKSRMGITGRLNYSKKVFEDVNISTKNSVFLNLGSKDGEWQFFKVPDFDTETSIDFEVNQFITTQINFHLVYDKEVESKWEDDNGVEQKGTRLQIKQFLTIGAVYNF